MNRDRFGGFGGTFYPTGIEREKARSRDTLWLKVVPRELVVTNINARLNHIAGNTVKLSPMWFLMPNQHMFSVQHTWDDLASPAGAIKDIASKIQNQLKVAKGSMNLGSGMSTGHKADNPYLYVKTDRRSFAINLDFTVFNDTYRDVFEPVQNLIEYSCPEIGGGYTEFTFPYVFSLQTYTGDRYAVDVISIKTAALTSVQPTYKAPWIDGYPSQATVDLNFVDLNPLYRGSLNDEKNKSIAVRAKNSDRGV